MPRKRKADADCKVSFRTTVISIYKCLSQELTHSVYLVIVISLNYYQGSRAVRLWNSIQADIATCVRSGVSAGRLIAKYNQMEENKHLALDPADVVIVIDSKKYSTVAGFGKLYDDFLSTKQLGEFSGKDEEAKKKGDSGYKQSKLRIMLFDESFHRVHTLPSDCKLC